MAKQRHSKESIIATLQNLAAGLKKDTLSKSDIGRVLPPSSVNRYFVNLGNALEAAGLKRTSGTDHLESYYNRLSDDDLFLSVLRIERQLGHEPKAIEYQANGGHSPQPFRARFGKTWVDTLKRYRKWKQDRSVVDSAPANEAQRTPKVSELSIAVESRQPSNNYPNMSLEPAQFYGEPIDFRGLRHAPINEQGVVYLFGMVSRELGFYIEAIQQGFPDCEGKYLHNQKKNLWAKARIEFEFRASSFKEYGHDPSGCDFVVCWINDWPDCPITVIELRKELLKLPAR